MPDWKPIAQCLYLSAQDIRAIETNVSLNFLMQCTETIKKWKSRFGFKAKYRMLVEAMLANKEEKIAFQFCRLVLSKFTVEHSLNATCNTVLQGTCTYMQALASSRNRTHMYSYLNRHILACIA